MSEEPVVALVLVRSEDIDAVGRALRADGFEIGPHLGIAMAITAPRDAFERVFGVHIDDAPDGGWVVAGGGRELPLERLPRDLAERIRAVTFEEPGEAVS